MATTQELKLVINGENKTAGAFNEISKKLQKVERDFQPAIKASQLFAGALLGIGAGAITFGVLTVKSASNAQKEMAKFDAVMKTMATTTEKVVIGHKKVVEVVAGENKAIKDYSLQIENAKIQVRKHDMALEHQNYLLTTGKINRQQYNLAVAENKNEVAQLTQKITAMSDAMKGGNTTTKISTVELTKTIEKQREGLDKIRQSFLDTAKASVKLGFDDEETANSLALLYQKTGDATMALRLNSMAMDLSRMKGIDLVSAGKALSGVLVGNSKAMRDLGIDIRETTDPVDMLAEAEKKLAGQTEAFADTFAGKMLALKIVFGNLMEDIGNKLLPKLTELAQKILDFSTDVLPIWIERSKEVIEWIKNHKEAVFILAGAIAGALSLSVIVFIGHLASMVVALAPFAIGGALITALVVGILWLKENWEIASAKIQEVWQNVVDKIMAIEPIKIAFEVIVYWFKVIWQTVRDGVLPVIQLLWQEIVNQLWPAIQNLWIALQPLLPYFEFLAKVVGGTLVVALVVFVAMLGGALLIITKVMQALIDLVVLGIDNASIGITNLTTVLIGFVDWLKSSIKWVESLITSVKKLDILQSAKNFVSGVGKKASAISNSVVQSISTVGNIPKMAEGGIVSRPTLALIGESGAEAVVPLGRGGFGGLTINISGNSFIGREGIAEKIGNDIIRVLKRNVQL